MIIPLAAPDKARKAQSFLKDETFAATVLFELFFFLPIGAYLYFFHPDWSMMYFLDMSALSEAARITVGACALTGYLAAAILGALCSRKLIRDDKVKAAYLVAGAVAVVLGVFSAFTIRQLTQIGTIADWTALPRTTAPIWLHQIGYVVGVDGTAATLALGAMLRSMKKN